MRESYPARGDKSSAWDSGRAYCFGRIGTLAPDAAELTTSDRATRLALSVNTRALIAAALMLTLCRSAAFAAKASPDSSLAPSEAAIETADSSSALVIPPGQRDVMDIIARLLHKPEVKSEVSLRAREGLSLTFLPSLGYNPSYGAFIGVSLAAGGWLGDPATTSVSSGSAGISYSTTGQTSIQARSTFFLPDNNAVLMGDWRYLDTSQPTFGLGPHSDQQSSYPMEFVLYRFYQSIFRRVGSSHVYAGVGYHFDRHDRIFDTRAAGGETTPYVQYSGSALTHTQSSGVSASVLVDTRDNAINARRGVYWNAAMRAFQKGLGSDDSWQMLSNDFRGYVPLPRGSRNALAIWSYQWFTFGHAPYLDLPATGWDTYGRGARGYLQGRIRAADQVYTEFEYRVVLRRDGLMGAVAFLNLMASTIESSGAFGKLDPGYGVGFRMKFNKRTDTNLAVDAADSRDNIVRFFFGLQEVF